MVHFERGKKRENNEGRRTHFHSRSCLCVWGGGAPEAALRGNRKETSEAFRQPAAQQTRLSSEAGWKSSGLLPSITGFSSCGSRSLLTHVSLPRIIFGSLGAPCSLPASHHSVHPPFLHRGLALPSPCVNFFPTFNRSLLHWEFFSSEQTTGILSSLNLRSAGSLYSSIW